MTPEERVERAGNGDCQHEVGDEIFACPSCLADAIRAAVEETRREMMLPCAACAERGDVVTRRMNTEPGECPHGYAFDCCTQCHEAFHAGRAEERERLAKLVESMGHCDKQAAAALIRAGADKKTPPSSEESSAAPERGAP